jgi:hypothetical protein
MALTWNPNDYSAPIVKSFVSELIDLANEYSEYVDLPPKKREDQPGVMIYDKNSNLALMEYRPSENRMFARPERYEKLSKIRSVPQNLIDAFHSDIISYGNPVRDPKIFVDHLQTIFEALYSGSALCLIGTAGNIADIEDEKLFLENHGSWASWWSFPIKDEAVKLLKLPFYLYINARGGSFRFRFTVQDYQTSKGNQGIVSPWPDITEEEYKGRAKGGDKLSEIFKTWLKVTEINSMTPPLSLQDFEPAEELSRESSLLNQAAFGYAYCKGQRLGDTSKTKPDDFQHRGLYLPKREDFENARRKCLREGKRHISVDDMLDIIEMDLAETGRKLSPSWRSGTEENIAIWSQRKE